MGARAWLASGLLLATGAGSPAAAGEPDDAAAAEPAPAAAGEAPAQDGGPERLLLRVQADDPRAVLEKRPHELEARGDLAGVDGWQAVCVAPCQARVDRRDRVRVGGSGLSPLELQLPPGPGPFEVAAAPGSSAWADAGFAMVLTGGLMLLAGGAGTLVLMTTGATKNTEPDSFADIMLHSSITTAVLGAVLLGISLPMRFAGDGTYTLKPSSEPGPSGAASSPPRLELGAGVSLVPGGLVF